MFSTTLQDVHAGMEMTFTDVSESSYAYEPVQHFHRQGLLTEKEDGTLGIHDKLTREQAIELVYSLLPTNTTNQKDQLGKYAQSLLRKDGGKQLLTREQAAKLMVFTSHLSATPTRVIRDVPANHPFSPFIQTAVASGLMSLDRNQQFSPKAMVTRGHLLTMLYRADSLRFPLAIMHTNDTHGNIQDFARRATAIAEVRAQHTNHLLLDAGDVFTGTLYFTKFEGAKDAELMNLVQYDTMALGNHEFDKSSAVLANFMKKVNFPLLSANLDFSKDADLNKVPGKHLPYMIKKFNGFQVGIFGLTTESFRETSSPSDEIAIRSTIESAKQTVATLRAAGVDKIIALTHIGLYEDMELAKQVPEIDVIVGGHTHDKLDAPRKWNNTLIVQAGQYGEHLGLLTLSFDRLGDIVAGSANGRLIRLNPNPAVEGETGEIAADPAIKTIVDAASNEINAFKNEIVGQSTVELDGVRVNVRSKETNLGNLIADSYLAYGKKLKNADLAIVNGGGIRASIPQGPISLGQVLTVMPFGNTMGVLDVTGAQLRQAMENGVSRVEFVDGRFPQVAGARYTFDKSKPAMQRVLSLEVRNEQGAFVAVDPAKTYRVVTNSFVMKGGDGYDVFNSAKYREDLFIVDYEMFLQYLANNPAMEAQLEERITEQSGQ
jgi:2',3'-cyclic-nucleotide 2'-phosphodiesterase/3'-nucleotidase/5'-nucleotidase